MKSNLFQVVSLFVLCFTFTKCDRPACNNNNPIFDQHQPDSKMYKQELAKQLNDADQSTLRYWLQKYEANGDKEFLYFYVQGEDLCAKLVLTMNHWERLEDLRKNKGVTYRNAKFTELKYQIVQGTDDTEFIYESFGEIKD